MPKVVNNIKKILRSSFMSSDPACTLIVYNSSQLLIICGNIKMFNFVSQWKRTESMHKENGKFSTVHIPFD